MGWLFKIYKLYSLNRLYKFHMKGVSYWADFINRQHPSSSYLINHASKEMAKELDEAEKIKNIIKFL